LAKKMVEEKDWCTFFFLVFPFQNNVINFFNINERVLTHLLSKICLLVSVI
jgi:hypothetical protein